MATQPTLKVQLALGDVPLDTTQTWTDVSAYVRQSPGVSIRRGKSPELDYFEAGTCQLTLSNRDRRFDPSYSSGPYYGQLLPRVQIHVSATWSAVDYVLFQGFVTGWPQSFAAPSGKDATVTIEAIDGTAWLAENRLPNDLVYSYANTTVGSLALFLRQADTSQWSDATSNGYYALVGSGVGRTSTAIAPGMASPSIGLEGSTYWVMPKIYTTTSAFSISIWVKTTDTSTHYAFGGPFDGAHATYLLVADTSLVTFSVNDGAGTAYNISVTATVADGFPHHIVVTSANTAVADAKIYIDGVLQTVSTSGSFVSTVRISVLGAQYPGTNVMNGSIQDFAVFSKALSAAEVLGLYQRSAGYLEESSTDRITRILDDVGWPAAWRSLAVDDDVTLGHSRATCGELVYNAKTALELLQEVERTEQGRVFVSRSGNLTFLGRYYNQEVTAGLTAQQIFSDDGGATALPYSTFGFRYNDLDVTNDATITTPATWAKASDSTSITNYGLQSDKVDTILSTFTAADAMARGLVARGKTGTWRVEPITVHPVKNTSRWANVLALELGQRVTIEQTPMAVGSQNAQDVAIESIEWLIENNLWMLMIAGSPVRDVWFIVGDSASLVDGTRVVGY